MLGLNRCLCSNFPHKGIESHIEILFKTRQLRTAFKIKVGNYLPTEYLNINLGNQFLRDEKIPQNKNQNNSYSGTQVYKSPKNIHLIFVCLFLTTQALIFIIFPLYR